MVCVLNRGLLPDLLPQKTAITFIDMLGVILMQRHKQISYFQFYFLKTLYVATFSAVIRCRLFYFIIDSGLVHEQKFQ